MEYFADNGKYSHFNDAFIDDLVHLYTAILTFLVQAHKYYTTGAAGNCFFLQYAWAISQVFQFASQVPSYALVVG